MTFGFFSCSLPAHQRLFLPISQQEQTPPGPAGGSSVLEGQKLCLSPPRPASQPFPPSQRLQLLVLAGVRVSFVRRDPTAAHSGCPRVPSCCWGGGPGAAAPERRWNEGCKGDGLCGGSGLPTCFLSICSAVSTPAFLVSPRESAAQVYLRCVYHGPWVLPSRSSVRAEVTGYLQPSACLEAAFPPGRWVKAGSRCAVTHQCCGKTPGPP